MSGQIRVAALVLNWNGSADTIELLQSLAEQESDRLALTVVVVDNASAENDYRQLEHFVASFKRVPVHLIRNATNIGVPAGYNLAIDAAGLKFAYYLRLDNDVTLNRGAIEHLCDAIQRNFELGVRIAGGNIKFYDRPDEDNGGAVTIDLVRGRSTVSYPKEEQVCDGVLGCIMLVHADVVERFFPEVFLSSLFLTADESELSLRCSRSGWKTLYTPVTLGHHKGARSVSRVARFSNDCSIRNWTFIALCYVRPKALVLLVAARVVVTLLYTLARGRWRSSRGILEGISAATRWCPKENG